MKINSFIEGLKEKMQKEAYSEAEIKDLRAELQILKNQLTVMSVFFDEIRTLLTEETDTGKTKLNLRGRNVRDVRIRQEEMQ